MSKLRAMLRGAATIFDLRGSAPPVARVTAPQQVARWLAAAGARETPGACSEGHPIPGGGHSEACQFPPAGTATKGEK